MITRMNDSFNVDERFRTNLKRLREERGWNQPELARRMVAAGYPSYSQMSVKRTEEGKRSVPLSEALSIAGVLGVRLDALLVAGEALEILEAVQQAVANASQSRENLVSAFVCWHEAQAEGRWAGRWADEKARKPNFDVTDGDWLLRFNEAQMKLEQLSNESLESVLSEARDD